MTSKRHFVIDTDPGTDDAQAILMALSCPDVEVKTITTVIGNTSVLQAAQNGLRTLQVAGVGNITASSEFNFYHDAEAAYVVLNQLSCPITIMLWETCSDHGLPLDVYHKIRSVGTPKAKFLKRVEDHSLQNNLLRGIKYFMLADELVMAIAIDRSVIKNSSTVYATVEVKGHQTYGQMVLDWNGILGKRSNVTIVKSIDDVLLRKMLLHSVDCKDETLL